MPGCAAIGCNNRSEKGYTMKCFPRDPNLRNIWKQMVGRADWEPSNNSFLCHVHFEPNQWVVTPSGRVKLKKGAIPSIFTVTSTRKSPKKRQKLGSQEIIDEDFEEEYEIEYLESDQPLILNLPNHNIVPNFINVQTQSAVIPSGQVLQNIEFISSDTLKNLRNENIIIVADENNREIGKIINESNIILLDKNVGKENLQILPNSEKSNNTSRVKVEIKEEVVENGLSNDDYDEIERKLEEICHSGNSSDSSNNVKNASQVNGLSIGTESIFSLDDLENGVDSVNENSNQEPESEITITRTGIKRKRSGKTESPSDDSTMDTSQITNGIDDIQLSENISDIIHDLVENSSECSRAKTKSVSSLPMKTIQNSQKNKSNKPIIKNDVQLEFRSDILSRPVQIKKNDVTSTSTPNPSNELLNKLDVQGEVIGKLTDQLIMYKDMDRTVKRLTEELEKKNKEIDLLNRRVSSMRTSAEKKRCKCDNMILSESSEVDLRNRIDGLEEQNKKLMKTVTLDAQNRRKLECQVKSRDNQIKELNWKLEKASKFLDRAEKNTNNYKKKMLSMQALVRRKKLSHEKTSILDEFLVGQANQSYSEKALRMALEIEKVCSQEGYQKLMEYDFPLPNLNHLHGTSDGSLREVDEDEDITLEKKESLKNNDVVSITKIKLERKEISEDNALDESNNDENIEDVEYLDLELLNDNSETVTGTVQDIFNEHSDSEEMDLSELRKHIMINFNDNT